ncbi:MAG: tetratricopeptide repeat protein [Deltaproteobacteria bacterium]|nr:tetratricopeptide repeat protein [Deltaproteobacteria bacterium]
MELLGVSNTDIFSATIQQTAQLESLSNGALSKGIDLYTRQDYEGAIKEFRRSVGLAPNSSYSTDASAYLANAYQALGDADGAVKAYEDALKRSPNRDDLYISLGNLHFSEEQYDEAAKAYQKAVKIWPSSDNHYALGQAYMNAERHSEADREFNMVLRMDPDQPNGSYGLGLNFSKQGRYEDAILQFKEAIRIDPKFYDGYAELGYAYADLGEMEEAQRVVDTLEYVVPDLADTLSRYVHKVVPPKFMFTYATSGFNFNMPWKTPLSALNGYLATPNAEKTLTMIFQFDKEMDRESVENVLNWGIGRSTQSGPGQAYNFGRPTPDTDVTLAPFPKHVYYDQDNLTATVYFSVRQNSAGDGTLDPAHLEFKFSGEDAYGHKMDPEFDQFMGFSGVA